MAEVFGDDVVIASVVPYGEADAVVRCFGRAHGRFSSFARGARSSRRRFPGLMAPALGKAILKPRRGTDMLDLQELDTDTRLMALGANLRAWGFAGYVIELVERFVPDGAPLPELFDIVVDTLVGLSVHGPKAAILRAFELRLLAELGVLPDLSDVTDDPGLPAVAYDPGKGHLLAHPTSGSVVFGDAARQASLFLLESNADDAVTLPVDDDVLREVSRIFSGWLRRQGVALRSLDVLRQLG